MEDTDRRAVLKALAGLPFASALPQTQREEDVRLVRAGADRTGQSHKAARADSHLDFKVLTAETHGALFVMENRNMVRGGPPSRSHSRSRPVGPAGKQQRRRAGRGEEKNSWE